MILATWLSFPDKVWYWSCLLWLGISGLLIGLASPQQRQDESRAGASRRSWRTLRGDAFTGIFLLITLFLLVQALNGGREMVYNAELEQWNFGAPALAWAASHVNTAISWQAVAWFCTFGTVALTVRHTMGKKLRLLLLHGVSINGALLALWWCIAYFIGGTTDKIPPQQWFFILKGSTATLYHLIAATIGLGLSLNTTATDNSRRYWLLLPPLLNLIGLLVTGTTLTTLCAWLWSLLAVVYGALYLQATANPKQRPLSMLFLGAFVVMAGLVIYKIADNAELLWSGITAQFAAWGVTNGTISTAWQLFANATLYGHGAGCFEILAPLHDWQVGATEVHGATCYGAVLALAEYGLAGCSLMLIALAIVISECVHRLGLTPQLPPASESWLGRRLLFRLSPVTVTALIGLAGVLVIGVNEPISRQNLAGASAIIILLSLASFLPLRKRI
ncbi:MAG: hypothetical protein GX230_11450 [Lentisphaerae bacterium]|jgi:hypothetical protein|nr:hypothetical protein [Lentisphaerota bacterium]